ncbi:MAG: pyruvate kinase [Kiritimatiellales bacterium]
MTSKQTKIICTLATNRCEPDFIRQLADAGMNVVRMNTAHMTPEEADGLLANIRSVSDRIGILIDTKGPEVRTRDLEHPLTVKTGDTVTISSEKTDELSFQVSYEHFTEEITKDALILIDDGDIGLQVTDREPGRLICTVLNDGVIKNKKSLNVPGAHLHLPSLTEKDEEFIDWAIRNDIDFIAHSFVRDQDDVLAIQKRLNLQNSPIKIIAKIENREGVENLESILNVAYGVMVARGDLGIEIPAEEVPGIQKQMIRTCIRRKKPVITATQMLHSMIENPRPTRAEVSDVANAILDGTDAIMLSGETAYGKFPLEAVQTMAAIAHTAEHQKEPLLTSLPVHEQRAAVMPRNHLAKAAVFAAAQLPVKAIITTTRSGETPRICASYRGCTPIFALSESMRTVRELSLSYGVYASKINMPQTTDELVKVSLNRLLAEKRIERNDLVVIMGGGYIYSRHTNFMQIDTAATLLHQ